MQLLTTAKPYIDITPRNGSPDNYYADDGKISGDDANLVQNMLNIYRCFPTGRIKNECGKNKSNDNGRTEISKENS